MKQEYDMKSVYKILVITAALVLGLQSCKKGEDDATANRYPILFKCSNLTRTASTTLTTLQENVFEVYAFYEVNGNKFNFNKDVTYSTEGAVWGYTGLEYWWPGATYNFKAFYPKGVATITNTSAVQPYTITYDITNQQDIVVATATATVADNEFTPGGGSNVVTLAFNHILTNVIVAIKSDLSDVVVESVKLGTISKKADYVNGGWSGATETTSYTYSSEEGVALDPGATSYTDVTDGGFMLIPQKITDQTFEIAVKISGVEKIYRVAIPEITWSAGMQYTYTMTIKQDNITFNEPSVVVWDVENATGSVIIK